MEVNGIIIDTSKKPQTAKNRSSRQSQTIQPETAGGSSHLTVLYEEGIPVGKKLLDPLIKLCLKGLIPAPYHDFYGRDHKLLTK